MKNITLYTISLLLTIGAGLTLILLPMDEIYSSFFLTMILIILACITRLFSKDVNQKGWDLIVLFAVTITSFFINLFPPMTIFFVTYGQNFQKSVMVIVIFISFIQLILSQRDWVYVDKNKERIKNIKLFFITIALTIITFFSFHLYGKTMDLNTALTGNQRIYLYSYRKYTPQIIETAFRDMENGDDQVTQKMAIFYLSDIPNISDEYKGKLEKMVFSKVVYGVGFEAQVDLMIKLNPSKTIDVLEEVNRDSSFNSKLVALDYLYKITKNNSSLQNKTCSTAGKIYQNAKKQVINNQWDLVKLDYPYYGGRIKDLCGIK